MKISSMDLSRLEKDLESIRKQAVGDSKESGVSKSTGFADLLEKGIAEVNSNIKAAETSSMELATGKNNNIHEAMIAASKAELGFNLLVQMRNKALESYQEVMRMQV